MPIDTVFTPRSLQRCLEVIEASGEDSWFWTADCPPDGSWGVLSFAVGDAKFVVHHDDVHGQLEENRRIVVMTEELADLEEEHPEAAKWVFQRIHRAALSAGNRNLRLPTDWNAYHHNNLLAFFAYPREFGSLRWVSEVNPAGSQDICFWGLTTEANKISLDAYAPPYDKYLDLMNHWEEVASKADEAFHRLEVSQSQKVPKVQDAIDLDPVTYGAVTRHRTYSDWLGQLTEAQRRFVEYPIDSSVKLKGPAGSGKTLALELKALRELYKWQDKGTKGRILFATHSWAMADQVDSALRILDERGDLTSIEVFPLVEIARSRLPPERADASFRLLGEDSFSGKKFQLERIDQVVQRIVSGDWLIHKGGCSSEFVARVQSPHRSPERNSLVWDLMLEFACVLSAHGILPGVNAEKRYLAIPRTPWMMPLVTPSEKKFALRVYTEYVGALAKEQYLTSDQLINDFLNYLETFTWNLVRGREGYDLIFVDELHLFNEQERLALNFLARSADEYPKLFMALDPRQAPYEVYTQFSASKVSRAESGVADSDLGDIKSVSLGQVHRFTPEILALVKHLHRSYPALELGEDWELDADALTTSVAGKSLPKLVRHQNSFKEVEQVLARAQELAAVQTEGRVAVVVLDLQQLERYQEQIKSTGKAGYHVIASKNDIDSLRYSKRSVVVSAAEYVAGMQFDRILVAGVPNSRLGVANLGLQRRRTLSLLYLAVTRATTGVEVHVNEEDGGVPDFLESAVRVGLMST